MHIIAHEAHKTHTHVHTSIDRGLIANSKFLKTQNHNNTLESINRLESFRSNWSAHIYIQ